MATRSPRTPPNRSRSRVRVPPIARTPGTASAGLTYERTLLTPRVPDIPKSIPGGTSSPAQARAHLDMDENTRFAMEELRDGDDSTLLPYQPTPSVNPPRPRTLAAGYDSRTRTVRIRFRNGQVYEYYDVPSNVWRNFRRVKSPGRMINRVLNNYEYAELHI